MLCADVLFRPLLDDTGLSVTVFSGHADCICAWESARARAVSCMPSVAAQFMRV